jgi:hypothetical protein
MSLDGDRTAVQSVQRFIGFDIPADQQGWRGLSLPGNRKRKCFTVLHNEQVLVTILLKLPGETGCRHSHESGELSIRCVTDLRPIIRWNPPGVLHGGAEGNADLGLEFASLPDLPLPVQASSPDLAQLMSVIGTLQSQVQALHRQVHELKTPEAGPEVIIDILFPPFKTTLDDPAYGEKRTVVGQWFD